MKIAPFAAVLLLLAGPSVLAGARSAKDTPPTKHARNVVIFVADGLRYDSVTKETAPTLWRVRNDGVDFANSHAVYPTVTTANASAIATGHYLGDTGDYANTLYMGYPVAAHLGQSVVFLEDDNVLRDVKQHFADDYLGQTTLLEAAKTAGLVTATIGKLGPSAIQDLAALDGSAILIDDVTNRPLGPDGLPTGGAALGGGLAGDIAQATGLGQPPLPAVPNVVQQTYLRTATAKSVLPYLKGSGKGFALLFWSRDPDASQHAQTDSLGKLDPGINGPTSAAAIANADASLKAILDALATLGLSGSTDVFVTADHGFSTIAKSVPVAGELPPSHLPQGFVAVSISNWLGQKLFDPDASNAQLDLSSGDHPSRGNGIVGPSSDAPEAVIAANGGSDLLYFPDPDARAHAKTVFDHLMAEDFVSGIFVNDKLLAEGDRKDFAGALPMSAINLIGSSNVPEPSMIVNFRSFVIDGCTRGPLLCAAEIADTGLTLGQGMHGTLSRADTRNFMAAIGPDFKAGFIDKAPVGNTDIAPTLARILGLTLPPKGALAGRVITEAIKGGKMPTVSHKTMSSLPGAQGLQTVLDMQIVGGARYFDAAGFPGRTVGLGAH